MTDQMQSSEPSTKTECPATREPAVRLFIMAGMAIGAGIYCGVDHFYRGMYKNPDPYELNAYLKYLFNHYGTFIFTLVGVAALVWAVMFLRRKLLADDEGIGYVGKDKILWSAVRELDASKLTDKGILLLRYSVDGKEKTLKLCSWKLQNFRSLVQIAEKKAPSDS